ncbi:MAG: sigma-70 family RNA polymerase sigma factor [Phycisphaera sp.]|nr:sigma-70 family RNA polymerase sigma factor [Phycisphaera sp.]
MSQPQHYTPEFIKALAQAQPQVYAFVMTLVGQPDVAQDVLQETNTVLLEKAAEYDTSRDFVSWACGIARYKALSHFRDRKRDRHVFGEAAMARLAEAAGRRAAQVADRELALRRCIDKLSDEQQQLVVMRYGPDGSVTRIAAQVGRSANAVSVSLSKIRKMLAECVRQQVAPGGGVA